MLTGTLWIFGRCRFAFITKLTIKIRFTWAGTIILWRGLIEFCTFDTALFAIWIARIPHWARCTMRALILNFAIAFPSFIWTIAIKEECLTIASCVKINKVKDGRRWTAKVNSVAAYVYKHPYRSSFFQMLDKIPVCICRNYFQWCCVDNLGTHCHRCLHRCYNGLNGRCNDMLLTQTHGRINEISTIFEKQIDCDSILETMTFYLRSHSNGRSCVLDVRTFFTNPDLHWLQQTPSVLCLQWYPNSPRSPLKWPFGSQYPIISISFTA